ncbi:MAG: 16S rRNA (uracil(1498)-N(3))-methyltransferase [Prevotella sp.]|nr:16S rRNA (uracil(1498)-N(3))-methyltransferase [Prevotella sp.]MDD5895312.1 RsmE family RNA methyltransferase [Prevotellaceae bacterium]
MKETRFFYVPNAMTTGELPEEEAMHALRVLRLKSGDEMMLTDGEGNFYRAEITIAATRKCMFRLIETLPQRKEWHGTLRLVVSPTKMMERMEWMVEKATEIGFDRISFINCDNSERRVVKTKRLEKIIVSAMKQSRKAWKPVIDEIVSFDEFMAKCTGGMYIAHCYDEIPKVDFFGEMGKLDKDADVTVMIGPEGDFSLNEVRKCLDAGGVSVSLGESRLRTETAGLASVMMAHLCKRR